MTQSHTQVSYYPLPSFVTFLKIGQTDMRTTLSEGNTFDRIAVFTTPYTLKAFQDRLSSIPGR
jgi:hypothetical protein